MKEKPLKIKLEFSVEKDAPFKYEIMRKFSELMQLLQKSNEAITKDNTMKGVIK